MKISDGEDSGAGETDEPQQLGPGWNGGAAALWAGPLRGQGGQRAHRLPAGKEAGRLSQSDRTSSPKAPRRDSMASTTKQSYGIFILGQGKILKKCHYDFFEVKNIHYFKSHLAPN